MPTSSIVTRGTYVTYRALPYGVRGARLGSSDFAYAKISKEWPNTVARPRPPDLFLSGTGRTVKSRVIRDGLMEYYADGTVWAGSPVASVYPMTTDSDYAMSFRQTAPSGGVRLSDPPLSLNRTSMYNKIRSDLRTEATNLAQALAEYSQTAKLFRDMAEVFATRGKSLVKRHPALRRAKRKADVPTSAANANLAFQYGILPLYSDLTSSIDDIRRVLNDPGRPLVIEGVETRRARAFNKGFVLPNSTLFNRASHSEVHCTLRYRTQWRAYLNKNILVSSLVGHGFGNPLALAWELVPYSFMVDWFVNVGDVLASLDNLLLCDRLMVIDSESRTRAHFVTTRPNRSISSGVSSLSSAFLYDRSDTRLAPREISRIVALQYEPSLSFRKLAIGLSLLRQQQVRR